MGELLRRYWMPFATVKQLHEHPTRAVTPARRAPGRVPRPLGQLRADPGVLPAPQHEPAVGHRRAGGAALPVPRLAVRRRGQLPRAARRAPRLDVQGPHQGAVAIPSRSWAGCCGPGWARGAAAAWCRAGRLSSKEGVRDIGWADPALQLAADHGELPRPRPRRVAAPLLHQLRARAPRPHRRRRPDSFWRSQRRRAAPREDRLRRLRARHHQAARARGRRRGTRRTGASATAVVFPYMLQLGQIRVPMDDTHTLYWWYNVHPKRDGDPDQRPEDIPLYKVPLPGRRRRRRSRLGARGQQQRPGQLRLASPGADHAALDRAPGRVRQGHHPRTAGCCASR